jgi:DNA primase
VAFSGRVLDPEAKTAKYVNSPETPLFSKGRVLYGLDKTKRDLIEQKAAIVCEGQLDLISAFEAGIRHVIAPQGTAFTGDQARLLRRFVETVLLCFDSDTAGQKAAMRSLPALLGQGLAVKVVELPEGEDPDSLIRSQGAGAFLAVVAGAKDFFEHATDVAERSGDLAEPAGKARLVQHLGPPMALIQDAALRESILGRLATSLALPQSAIRAAMKAPKPDAPDEVPAVVLETLALSPGMQRLCHLALISQDVRDWLKKKGTAADLDPHGDLLDQIAQAGYADDDPAAATRFLSQIGGAAERAFSGMDLTRPLAEPLSKAQETFAGLEVQKLLQKVEGLKNRLGLPGLPTTEILKIQKQILDLKILVAEASRPLISD